MGKKIDIDRAIDAFRRTCPDSTELKHLDGTTEIYECFGSKCKEHSYRCNYICKRLRRFIDILKEPEQQDYGTVHIKHRKENSMTGEEIITVIKAMKDPVGDGDYWKGYNAALDDLLSFIDSTGEEHISEEMEKKTDIRLYANIPTKPIGEDDMEDAALVIANCYGKQWQPAAHGFILGVRWKMQRILKDAIDGVCISNGMECGSTIQSAAGMLFLPNHRHNVGDKVKLVIIKED